MSDGADTASDRTPTELKQKLVRTDVFLYAIGIDSLDARNSTRINPFTLNELTSQGGGYTEIIRSTAELGPATERIAEELNHQYMIGYTPTTRADGSYHTVRVKVSNDTLQRVPRPVAASFAAHDRSRYRADASELCARTTARCLRSRALARPFAISVPTLARHANTLILLSRRLDVTRRPVAAAELERRSTPRR